MADSQDGLIAVQLARWATTLGLFQAALTVASDEFDPESASSSDDAVAKLLEFGETVGGLTKHGVVDIDLVRDLWWFEGIWPRVAPAAQKDRDKFGESSIWSNFEALATSTSG